MIEDHAETTYRHAPTGFAPWGVHDFVATMARLVALTCSIANIGNYGRTLVRTHLYIRLDRLAFCLAFCRTAHLYIRQYKHGRRGSVLSSTAAWDRLEDHPQGAQKHL